MQKRLYNIIAMAVIFAGISAAGNAQSIKAVINFTAPTQGLSVDPFRDKIYVVAPDPTAPSDNLAVINGASDTVIHNVQLPSGSLFVAVDYLAARIYVAGCNYNVDPSPCTVTVIDEYSLNTLKTIPITTTPGFGLTGIVVNPVTQLVYVANGSDNVITVIEGSKEKVLGDIYLDGNSPAAVALNPILGRLYVPFGTNEVGIVDTHNNFLIKTTEFGSVTVGAASNIVDGNVFVTDQEIGPSQTGVFDATGKLLKSITVDDAPLGVDVDPFTNLAFVVSTALDNVTVIDGATHKVTAVVTGVPGSYVAVNYSSRKVYVSGQIGVTVLGEK
jgi:DNA-binding beta-propeller fold protein YncE